MSAKRVTIRDVAREAGVGVGTVSRVLNSGAVKTDTRQRVLKTIEKLGYKPNIFARSLAGGKSRRILTLIPEVKSEFHWRILESFDHQLDEYDFQSIIYPLISKKRYEALINNPSFAQEVEGVVMMTITPEILKNGLYVEVPVVLIEENRKDFSCVFLNNYRGGVLAANRLIERGATDFYAIYSSIANPLIKNRHMQRRIDGFRDALEEYNIELYNHHIIYSDYSIGPSTNNIRDMLSGGGKPGIFALTDNFALLVLQVASTIGKKPGKDFYIIGYDNQSWTEKIGLTTIEQPIEEFGKTGAKLILEKIENPESPVRQVEFSPVLIDRNTA